MFHKLMHKAPKRKMNMKAQMREVQELQLERDNLLSSKSDFFIREAYKTLRTNVTFSLTGENSSSTILVTSSMQGEGKTFTALNLAISFAQAEKKVLLIDCDLRRPKVSRLLKLNNEIGLSNVLMQPDFLSQAILPTHEKNFSVMLSGDIPPNPSELLGSVRMTRLLDALKGQFDYVILDTPPVNVVTDSMVLAPQCDGVLFVVRAGQSERGAVMHAVDQLRYGNAKLLGFVMNGADTATSGYGGYRKKKYGKYNQYYGYGYYQQSYSMQNSADAENHV